MLSYKYNIEGATICIMYSFTWNNNKFILLSVFIKQTRKTPKKEIEKAKRYLQDFKKRSDNDGE